MELEGEVSKLSRKTSELVKETGTILLKMHFCRETLI